MKVVLPVTAVESSWWGLLSMCVCVCLYTARPCQTVFVSGLCCSMLVQWQHQLAASQTEHFCHRSCSQSPAAERRLWAGARPLQGLRADNVRTPQSCRCSLTEKGLLTVETEWRWIRVTAARRGSVCALQGCPHGNQVHPGRKFGFSCSFKIVQGTF